MTATIEPNGPIPPAHEVSSLEAENAQHFDKSNPNLSLTQEWSDHAQEILDALPRTWTRGLLYFLVIFLSIGIPWAVLTKVDETGSARGRLELKGNTVKKEADVPAAVAVTAVYVKEGDSVKTGQVLLELDSRSLRDDLKQQETKLEGQQDRLTQLNILKNQIGLALGVQRQQNQAQELEKLAQVDQARRTLDTSRTSYQLQKVEKLAPVDQAKQAVLDSRKVYELADLRVNAAQREVERYKKLYQQGVVAEIKVREMEAQLQDYLRQRNQTEAEIKQNQLRFQEQQKRYQSLMYQAGSDIKQSELRLQEQENGYQSLKQGAALAITKTEQQLKEMEAQLVGLKSEIAQTKTQIQSLKRQLEKYTVRAPLGGVLFQFPVKQPQAVVQPKDLIAEIAPQATKLVFRGQIPTSQSESIRSGQQPKTVKLKFDEFPFQDYEVVTGKLVWVSPDSKVIQAAQGNATVYELEVELQKNCIQAEGKCVPFKAGQPAAADVVIRQRRIIDLLLDPFQKLRKGEFKL